MLQLKDLMRKKQEKRTPEPTGAQRVRSNSGACLGKRVATEGVRRTAWRTAIEGQAGVGESCRPNQHIIAYWYSLSMINLSGLDAAG